MKKVMLSAFASILVGTAFAQTTTTQTFYGKNTGSSETVKTTGSGSSTITIKTISINCDNFYSFVCYSTTTTTSSPNGTNVGSAVIDVYDDNNGLLLNGPLLNKATFNIGGTMTRSDISVVAF